MKESITRRRLAPSIASIGSLCDLNLKIPGEDAVHTTRTCPHSPPLADPLSHSLFLSLVLFLSSLGNWFQMVSAQDRLTRTFTRSSHTYTRTERTEISKTRGGETKREVHVEESRQVGGDPFRDVFGSFLGRESFSGFGSLTAKPDGKTVDHRAERFPLGSALGSEVHLPHL